MHVADIPARQVGVREFRDHLTTLLRDAAAGQTLLIAAHGKVLAELRPPPPPAAARRRPGALRGQIRMEADFDATPDDLLDAMEGAG
jgi:antitoxin (DNA-binding transcriptional repressor) of toxin-antitoxin stability system